MTPSRGPCLALVALLAAALGASPSTGCRDKPAPAKIVAPTIAGMDAVPASAQVVLSFDLPAVLESTLVTRAIGQLLARDPDLAKRWQTLRDSCRIQLGEQVRTLLVAVGAPAAGQRPALLVATGKLVEADLASCVRSLVGSGGGTLTMSDQAGRMVYKAQEGSRTVFFTFGQPDTVIFSASATLLNEATSTGPRFAGQPAIAAALARTKRGTPIWGVGVVDGKVGQGLVKASAGKITTGPTLMRVEIDPRTGLAGQVVLVMASEADAWELETFATAQLSLLAMASQVVSRGPVVGKTKVSRAGAEVTLATQLTNDDLNHLLTAIDRLGADKQDASPSAPGSAAPP